MDTKTLILSGLGLAGATGLAVWTLWDQTKKVFGTPPGDKMTSFGDPELNADIERRIRDLSKPSTPDATPR